MQKNNTNYQFFSRRLEESTDVTNSSFIISTTRIQNIDTLPYSTKTSSKSKTYFVLQKKKVNVIKLVLGHSVSHNVQKIVSYICTKQFLNYITIEKYI